MTMRERTRENLLKLWRRLSLSNLSAVTLTLYNGGNGASYAGPTPLSSFTRRDTVSGFAFYTLDISLQNGAPDGLALAMAGQVLQFLSYEGAFTATDGVARRTRVDRYRSVGAREHTAGFHVAADWPRGQLLRFQRGSCCRRARTARSTTVNRWCPSRPASPAGLWGLQPWHAPRSLYVGSAVLVR